MYYTHRRLEIITFIIDLVKYNTHTFSAEQKRTSVVGSPFEHDTLSVTFVYFILASIISSSGRAARPESTGCRSATSRDDRRRCQGRPLVVGRIPTR